MKFLRGKIRTAAWETAPQIALRDRSKEAGVGEVNIWGFGEGGAQCNQMLSLQEVFCQSPGADVTMKGFSDFSIYEEM